MGISKRCYTKTCRILTVKGGTGKIIEYFGEGTGAQAALVKEHHKYGRRSWCNTSIFPYDKKMYERFATSRKNIGDEAEKIKNELKADEEVPKSRKILR